MKKKFKFIRYLTILLPFVFLWTGINFNRGRYVNDPNYIYLMNALCICDGQSVGNIDNPGTTVMQVGAVTITVMHLFSKPENESLISHVIHDPERFVEGIRIVFVILNSFILFLLGWIAIKKTGKIWLALLLQASPLVSSNTLEYTWTKLSPEPLLFFVTGVYVLILLYFYFEEDKTRWKYVVLFSLITGAGLATKANFLPLIILPLVVLPSFKKKVCYLFGIIPAFILFTIPAIPEYKSLFFWFRSMIQHTGMYGNGKEGIIDTQTYLPDVVEILKNNPIISLILVIGIVTLIINWWKNGRKSNCNAHFLAGLIGTFILGVLLVAKHYREHYLIPVLLLSGITIYFILNIIGNNSQSKILKSILLPVTTATLIFIVGFQQPRKMIKINRQYKAANIEIDSTNLLMEQNYADYTRINYYIFSLNKFTGLKFGNDFAKQKILPYLKDTYPSAYFYEFSSDQFLNWNQKTRLNDIIELHGNKVLLVNGPADNRIVEEIRRRGFPLKKAYGGKAQNLYVLDSLKYDENIHHKTIHLEN